MVGQGVLRECLLDADIQVVATVGRSATGIKHAKLREIVRPNLQDYADIEAELRGFDACFFCLGVTSAGISETDYERVTYGITLAAAGTLARLDPGMTFIYASGAGTDSSEKGRVMWARVKGKTENTLLRLPFKAAYMFLSGSHRGSPRGAVQEQSVPGGIQSGETLAAAAPPLFSELDPDDRGDWPRDD